MFDVRCSSFKLFDIQSLKGSNLDIQNSFPVIKKMNRFAHPFDPSTSLRTSSKLRTSSAKRKAKRNPDLWPGFLCILK
jgi:hypothetical protein